MRTIQLIISAIADTIVETRGQSSKQDDISDNQLKTEENKNKKNPTSQNVTQTNGKSTPDIESDDLTKEEE